MSDWKEEESTQVSFSQLHVDCEKNRTYFICDIQLFAFWKLYSLTMTSETSKLVVIDTDMGSDDAWALQMMLKAEELLKTIKILAITTVIGNTTTDNVIKNTYRILDGLNRTDVRFPLLQTHNL